MYILALPGLEEFALADAAELETAELVGLDLLRAALQNAAGLSILASSNRPTGQGIRTEASLDKKADDLISGQLKRSPSYHAELGQTTYRQILKDSAKSQAARQMKKLIEQAARLGFAGSECERKFRRL